MDPSVEYREIPGFHGYLVGDDGSVWSSRRGGAWTRLSGNIGNFGYLFFRITDDSGKPRTTTGHSLVLLAFRGQRPIGLVSRHLDGNPANNILSNLVYGTQKENIGDCILHGTIAHGERCGRSKLTMRQVDEIRAMRSSGLSFGAIAKKIGVCKKTIGNICHAKTWIRSSQSSEPTQHYRRVSNDEILLAVEMLRLGKTKTSISREIGVSLRHLIRVLNGQARSEDSGIEKRTGTKGKKLSCVNG